MIGERHEPQGATTDAEESALGISSRIASKSFGDPSLNRSEFSDFPRNVRFLLVCDPRLHRLTVTVSNRVAGWSERRG